MSNGKRRNLWGGKGKGYKYDYGSDWIIKSLHQSPALPVSHMDKGFSPITLCMYLCHWYNPTGCQ